MNILQRKVLSTTTCDTMNGFHKKNVEQKEPGAKECTANNLIFTKYKSDDNLNAYMCTYIHIHICHLSYILCPS